MIQKMHKHFDHAREIDHICDSFEQAWLADESIRLEQFLESDLKACSRSELLKSLLLLELELINRDQALPCLSTTLERFPQDQEIVLTVYQETQSFVSDRSIPENIGPYEIEEEIGHGAFGTVYRAYDSRLKRIVALKILHTWYASIDDFVERFEREAQAASDLNHPNICLVLDIGFAEGRHYYAMQYGDGFNLAQHIAKHGTLPIQDVSQIILKLTDALELAHKNGIIHRDLKPENILLSKAGEPCIVDFGLAQGAEQTLSDPLRLAGTPSYMAPEQLYDFSGESNVTTDIYSLAAITFEMLTGKSPGQVPSAAAERERFLHSSLSKHLNIEAIGVLKKAMAANPDTRYKSASEFAGDFIVATKAEIKQPFAVLLIPAVVIAFLSVALLTNWVSHGRKERSIESTNVPTQARKVPFEKSELYGNDWGYAPVALAEWLEGRELLTVAQDGSAMFSSIEEALSELKPRQVVRILDRGPYQERFDLVEPPKDSGLVSAAGTIIEIDGWGKRQGYPSDYPFFVGCSLRDTIGFRLSGITFVAEKTPSQDAEAACILWSHNKTSITETIPLIIDHCKFEWAKNENWSTRSGGNRPRTLKAVNIVAPRNSSPVFLHQCCVKGYLDLDIYTIASVTKNLVEGKMSKRAVGITPGISQKLSFVDNFFIGQIAVQIGNRSLKKFELYRTSLESQYHFQNNYLEGKIGINVVSPDKGVEEIDIADALIEYNVFNSSKPVTLASEADTKVANERWTCGMNYFYTSSEQDPRHALKSNTSDYWDAQPPARSRNDAVDASTLRSILRIANSSSPESEIIGPRLGDISSHNDWLMRLFISSDLPPINSASVL